MHYIGLLQRFRGLQDRGPGRPCPAADLPNDLQHLSVIARHGGVTVAVHPGALFDALRRIPLNRQANAREGRQQHMLVEGGLIAKTPGKIINMFGFHPGAGKAGGSAAGQPLAKAIPVIFPHHAGLLGADQGYHVAGGITAPGKHIDPVGVQRAGAVKLLAIETPALLCRRHPGVHLAQLNRADLRPAAAHQLAVEEATKPAVAPGGIRLIQLIFHKGKVRAQGLRQVRVRLRQLDQQRAELRQRSAPAALLARDTQRAEARFLQPADRLIGQNALLFALRSALGDTGEYRAEGGRQRVIIGASGEQGHCQFLIHEVRRYLLASVHDGPPAGRKWE